MELSENPQLAAVLEAARQRAEGKGSLPVEAKEKFDISKPPPLPFTDGKDNNLPSIPNVRRADPPTQTRDIPERVREAVKKVRSKVDGVIEALKDPANPEVEIGTADELRIYTGKRVTLVHATAGTNGRTFIALVDGVNKSGGVEVTVEGTKTPLTLTDAHFKNGLKAYPLREKS